MKKLLIKRHLLTRLVPVQDDLAGLAGLHELERGHELVNRIVMRDDRLNVQAAL